MNITLISDTHGEHGTLGRLSGEVLIHCGDMFNMYSPHDEDIARMDEWFGEQRFDLIICIGGNHDFPLASRGPGNPSPFRNAVYLEGSSHVHEGLRFFGAPWVPELAGQAFFCKPKELVRKWAGIPDAASSTCTQVRAC